MARTRKTSREALGEKIEKAEADVIAAKKRYDHATAVLKELLDKRDAIRKDEILSAIVKSGRSYEEIMNFLNVEETKEQTGNAPQPRLQCEFQAENFWKFTLRGLTFDQLNKCAKYTKSIELTNEKQAKCAIELSIPVDFVRVIDYNVEYDLYMVKQMKIYDAKLQRL